MDENAVCFSYPLQKKSLGGKTPDGLVEPYGKPLKALTGGAPVGGGKSKAGGKTDGKQDKPKGPPLGGLDMSALAERLYEAMFGGFSGLGTDEDEIFSVLGKLDKDNTRIQQLKAAYTTRYGRDLGADLRSELSDSILGKDLSKALDLLTPKKEGAGGYRQVDGAAQPTSKPATRGKGSSLVQMLRDEEGYSLTMYPDTESIPTIGIGYNLKKPGAKRAIEDLGFDYEAVVSGNQSITDAAVRSLFKNDLATAQRDIAAVVPNLGSHPQEVQDVLTDMMFNMGVNRLSGFKNMLAAVNAKDYNKAADEMENSKWFGQVKSRGPKLVDLMRSAAGPATRPSK